MSMSADEAGAFADFQRRVKSIESSLDKFGARFEKQIDERFDKQDVVHIKDEMGRVLCGCWKDGIHHGGPATATCVPCLQRSVCSAWKDRDADIEKFRGERTKLENDVYELRNLLGNIISWCQDLLEKTK